MDVHRMQPRVRGRAGTGRRSDLRRDAEPFGYIWLSPSPRKEIALPPGKEQAPPPLPYPLTQPPRSPVMRATPAHCALPSIRKSRRSPLVAVSVFSHVTG